MIAVKHGLDDDILVSVGIVVDEVSIETVKLVNEQQYIGEGVSFHAGDLSGLISRLQEIRDEYFSDSVEALSYD